jgi:hypothetical protein
MRLSSNSTLQGIRASSATSRDTCWARLAKTSYVGVPIYYRNIRIKVLLLRANDLGFAPKAAEENLH